MSKMQNEKLKMKNDKLKFKKGFQERVYKFTLKLIGFVDTLPKDNASRIISSQLIRSGTSIGANYIESYAASSKRDFTNFFHHALKSANESKFWLSLLRDSGKAAENGVEILLSELEQIASVLASSLLTLKGKR